MVKIVYPGIGYPNHLHKTIYVDRQFDTDDYILITQAASEWAETTHHIIELDTVQMPTKEIIDADNAIFLVRVSPDFPDILITNHFNHNDTLGLYQKKMLTYIELVADEIENDEQFVGIIEHEIGHAIGCKHNLGMDGIGTLMYPYTDMGSSHITKKDIQQLCTLYHCDADKLWGKDEE